MQSQKVHSLLVILSLMCTLVGAAVAAPPENSSQGAHGGAVQDMPEDASHEMLMAEDGAPATQATMHLSPEQRQMIGVTSATVERTILKKTIRAVARIDFDERRLADVTFKVSGWVQELFVDYHGRPVGKG